MVTGRIKPLVGSAYGLGVESHQMYSASGLKMGPMLGQTPSSLSSVTSPNSWKLKLRTAPSNLALVRDEIVP